MELLIVVAIIAVLVAICVPVFSASNEKAKEAADIAEIRSAYSEVLIAVMTDDNTEIVKTVNLKQTKDSWQNTELDGTLHNLGVVKGNGPSGNGKCEVGWDTDLNKVYFSFSEGGSSSGESSSSDDGIISFPSKAEDKDGFARAYALLIKKYIDDGVITLNRYIDTQYEGHKIAEAGNYSNYRTKIINQVKEDGYSQEIIDGIEAKDRSRSDLTPYYDETGELLAYRYDIQTLRPNTSNRYDTHRYIKTPDGTIINDKTESDYSSGEAEQIIADYYWGNN